MSGAHPACFRDGSRFLRSLSVGIVVTVVLVEPLRLREAFPIDFLMAIVFDQALFFREGFRANAAKTRAIFGRWLPSRVLLLGICSGVGMAHLELQPC
ncbi:MAG: hypothetical protein ACKOCM_07220 [Cyanobacteriota bacterium]